MANARLANHVPKTEEFWLHWLFGLGVDTKGRPDRPVGPVTPEIKWTSQAQAEIDPNKPDHITSIGPWMQWKTYVD